MEQLSKLKVGDPAVIFIRTIQHTGEVTAITPTVCGNYLYSIRTETPRGELVTVTSVPEEKVYSYKPTLKYRLSTLDDTLEPIILEESFVKAWLHQLALTLNNAKVEAIDIEDHVIESITYKEGITIDHTIDFTHA